uniref:CUB domain containing protein 1a n=1 Tax=Nothobranchius furzeri TaxID=105023 RepID=A0A1A8B7Y8_NOTFU
MSFYRPGSASALILPAIFFYLVSGVQMLTVTPDPNTTINISSSAQNQGCQVCTGSGSSQLCSTSLLLTRPIPVSVTFTCPKPQGVFSVEILQYIEMKTSSFSGLIIQKDSGSQSLLDFQRRFTWTVNATLTPSFGFDFNATGLRQIHPSVSCPDHHTYTLWSAPNVLVGKFCRFGPISRAQFLNLGIFSLDVPAGQRVQQDNFSLFVGEIISSTKVSLTLPIGNSSSELLSPNYPNSFSSDDVMEWSFMVPAKHTTAVTLHSVTQPKCVRKTAAVEYTFLRRAGLVYRLDEPQPGKIPGSFSMVLRNCEMDETLSSSGLTLNVMVSVSSDQVLCNVDLHEDPKLSLHVINVSPDPRCTIQMNSVSMRNVTVTSKAELLFQGCRPEDVQVTADGVVDCSVSNCSGKEVDLFVPKLSPCLPSPLTSVTWTLIPSPNGAVALFSPAGPLSQALPKQPCNDSLVIKVDEEGGSNVGHFCHQGAIKKVLVHSKVVVTLMSTTPGEELRTNYQPVLQISFEKSLSENYIFYVSPSKDTTFLVGTPGWPAGMKSYSTVSWIVSFPSKMDAQLMFPTLDQPECTNGHTSISVQRFNSPEEDYSRTEEEVADNQITVSESFYLNMSNCMVNSKDFRVVTQITLQKSISRYLIIILAVVAALLVIFIILLVVICQIVRKKKKKESNPAVAVYNSGDTNFRQQHNGLSDTCPDSDSHTYASIDDSLVYYHLLEKGKKMGLYKESDTLQTFTRHVDAQKPLGSKDSSSENVSSRFSSVQDRPLPDQPPGHTHALVDNEIYQSGSQRRGVV